MRKSGVLDESDEDATRMLATCLQQVVRVGLVEFEERHDTRTNGQHYTATDRRPTNRACRRAYVTRMLRRYYEETAPVEFQLYCTVWRGGGVVRGSELQLLRSRVRHPAVPPSVNDRGQAVHTHLRLTRNTV